MSWRAWPVRTGISGFSLVEVLVAVSLVSVLMVTTLTWVVRQGALSRTLSQRLEQQAVLEAIARVMSDDLLQAVSVTSGGRCTVAPAAVVCTTLNQVAGERPGYHRVSWIYDAVQATLTRLSEGERGERSERVVTRRFLRLAFSGSGSAVALTATGTDQRELSVQVWSEPQPAVANP